MIKELMILIIINGVISIIIYLFWVLWFIFVIFIDLVFKYLLWEKYSEFMFEFCDLKYIGIFDFKLF